MINLIAEQETNLDFRGQVSSHAFTKVDANGAVISGAGSDAGDIPLGAFMQAIQETRKVDLVCPRKDIELDFSDFEMDGNKGTKLHFNLREDYRIPGNAHCISQFYTGLGNGANAWFAELSSRGRHDLIANQVNQLLKDDKGKSLVRTIDNNGNLYGRAVVSESFKPIDDDIVFGTALPIIAESSAKWRAIGGQRTDLRSYAKIVSREPVFIFNDGKRERPVFAGFVMSNSEVGQGYATFQAFLCDGYCSNAAILGTMVVASAKFSHRGSKVDTIFGPIFNDRIKELELSNIRGLISDATKIATDPNQYDQARAICEISTQREMNPKADLPLTVREVCKRVGLTSKQIDNVVLHFDSTVPPTQYQVQAAITSAAQKADGYENRIDMEKAGGAVLAMSANVWNACQMLS